MNCHTCKHRGTVPNSVHSSCKHPQALELISSSGDLFEFLRVLINQNRIPEYPGLIKVNQDIVETYEPIQNGWLTWPFNFDPRWIDTCKGYQEELR